MHNHRRSILLLICLTVLCVFVKGQNPKNQTYFLRHSLIFFSDKTPEVSSNNIVFTDESICGFYPKVYESPILSRNTEVKIISVDKQNDSAKVIFEAKQKNYEILIKSSSKKDFEKSFSLVFSDKTSKDKDKEVTSWKSAIKQFGFPITKCKDSASEKWFYTLEFSPMACGSYDGCVIEVNKKGVSISGYN